MGRSGRLQENMHPKIADAISNVPMPKRSEALKEYFEDDILQDIIDRKFEVLSRGHFKRGQITQEELQKVIPFWEKIMLNQSGDFSTT